jgi:catechol 2,3-dioxygenase-like lactoylglutathione lyase family enzyme
LIYLNISLIDTKSRYEIPEGSMPSTPNFDLTAAHKYFAAYCFNKAWDLIETKERTAEENRLMVALNQASIFHWLSREDCHAQNLSVGFWQASRIQALLGDADQARRYAQTCLSYSHSLEPFFLGYAFEALARAEFIAGDSMKASKYLEVAKSHAARVERPEDKQLLMRDLSDMGECVSGKQSVPHQAIPILSVSDAPRSAQWYQRLGFKEDWRHQYEAGFPWFVSISTESGATLFLTEHREDCQPRGSAFLVTRDIKVLESALDLRAELMPWGDLELSLCDPDGNRIRISEPGAA